MDESTQVVSLVDQLVRRAITARASDIHLEPKDDRLRVRFRVDGVMVEQRPMPLAIAASMVSRVKVMAKMDISERRLPQDGNFSMDVAEAERHMRVSTFPSCYGEKVVLRILSTARALTQLNELGIPDRMLPSLIEATRRPSGLILTTGPTGSGKTSTLYSLINSLDQISRNIVTLEDPIEIKMPELTQGETNVRAGFTFASGLRSILRQDPDVILVGEVRDVETAEIVFRSALTGHLVLSTLHTSSTVETITRLLDMNLEPFIVASALAIIIAQRLVRRLCDLCKRPAPTRTAVIEQILGFSPESVPAELYEAVGCTECSHTGYRSRLAIFEVVAVDDDMRDLIRSKASTQVYRQMLSQQKVPSLRREGWTRVLAGETTIQEVMRVC